MRQNSIMKCVRDFAGSITEIFLLSGSGFFSHQEVVGHYSL